MKGSLTRDAFEEAVRTLQPRLTSYANRMLAHPEDAADAVQDALTKAYDKRAAFAGRAQLSTWLYSILTRTCLDRLRHRQRWRWDAQALTRDDPEAPHDAVHDVLLDPDTRFDVREHIAFCFGCVARSLPPEEAAALLLREVYGLGNREAAKACGVSESVLRHRLSAARTSMQDAFEKLCALVSKDGVCYQCAGLRDQVREDRRGEAPPNLTGTREASLRKRLVVLSTVGAEPPDRLALLHELMLRAIRESEARRDARDRMERANRR